MLIDPAAQFRVLSPEEHRLKGAGTQRSQHIQVDGLLDEFVGPALDRLLCSWDVAVGGHHDGLGRLLGLTSRSENLHPIGLALHLQICDDQVKLSMLQFIERPGQVMHEGADMPKPTEDLGHNLRVVRFVIHDQDLGGG